MDSAMGKMLKASQGIVGALPEAAPTGAFEMIAERSLRSQRTPNGAGIYSGAEGLLQHISELHARVGELEERLRDVLRSAPGHPVSRPADANGASPLGQVFERAINGVDEAASRLASLLERLDF